MSATESVSTLPSEREAAVAGEGSAESGGTATLTAIDERTEPFCAQRAGRLFHRRDCAWVSRIAEGDRVYLDHMTDATDRGFVKCPVCEPWEPA